jgi:hypothetical protein
MTNPSSNQDPTEGKSIQDSGNPEQSLDSEIEINLEPNPKTNPEEVPLIGNQSKELNTDELESQAASLSLDEEEDIAELRSIVQQEQIPESLANVTAESQAAPMEIDNPTFDQQVAIEAARILVERANKAAGKKSIEPVEVPLFDAPKAQSQPSNQARPSGRSHFGTASSQPVGNQPQRSNPNVDSSGITLERLALMAQALSEEERLRFQAMLGWQERTVPADEGWCNWQGCRMLGHKPGFNTPTCQHLY